MKKNEVQYSSHYVQLFAPNSQVYMKTLGCKARNFSMIHLKYFLARYMEYLRAEATIPGRYSQMKKFTTLAVIATLALATQAFAIGGTSSKGGQTMSTTMSKTTMSTGSKITSGTQAMTSSAPMKGAGTMTTRMSATGTTKPQITAGTPTHQAAAK